MNFKPKKEQVLGFFLVLVLSFLLIMIPHLNSNLPLHSDSYDNIAFVQSWFEKGGISFEDPYVSPNKVNIPRADFIEYDFESGYAIILAAFSLLPMVNPVDLPIFFPWLVSMLLFFSTFVLLRKIVKDDFSAFFTAFFVFFIPSSRQMLGPLFLVASNVGLALLPILLYFGLNALRERKDVKKFALVSVITLIVYPPAFIVSIISLVVFSLVNQEIWKKNQKQLLVSGGLITAMGFVFIIFALFLSNLNPVAIFLEHGFDSIFALMDLIINQFILRHNILDPTPSFGEYLGLVLFALSIISTLFFLIKKFLQKNQENPGYTLIFVPAIVLSTMAFISIQIGRGIFLPTERTVFFASYFLLLSTGLFTAQLIMYTKNLAFFENFSKKFGKNFLNSVFLLFLVFGIFLSAPVKSETFQFNITPNEFDAIDWINSNTQKDDLFLAVPYLSKPIKVFTGRNVVCTTFTRFGCSQEMNLFVTSFFFVGCDDKQKILEDYFNADYVFVQKKLITEKKVVEFPEQNCGFLELVFDGKNIKIYKTIWS